MRWYAVLLSGAGALVLAAGIFRLAWPPAHPVADCGLVTCSATLPAVHASGGVPSKPPGRLATTPAPSPAAWLRARTAHAQAPPTPGGPGPALPSPAPAPSQSPNPPPSVASVSYAVDLRWPGGFQGQFTIVNHGSTPLSGWVLTAVLPGDRIYSVWSADYSTDGSTLTLTPAPYEPVIPPGGTQSAFFTASGDTTEPSGCTFDNQACGG